MGIITFYTMFVWSVGLWIFFDHYKLLSTALYYFQWLYTAFDGFILLSTAIYYFRRYTLLSALGDCDLVRTQDSPILFCGLKGRFEFNINLLILVQFCDFCGSMVFSINFNSHFWMCCFIRNFLYLPLEMVHKGNK